MCGCIDNVASWSLGDGALLFFMYTPIVIGLVDHIHVCCVTCVLGGGSGVESTRQVHLYSFSALAHRQEDPEVLPKHPSSGLGSLSETEVSLQHVLVRSIRGYPARLLDDLLVHA